MMTNIRNFFNQLRNTITSFLRNIVIALAIVLGLLLAAATIVLILTVIAEKLDLIPVLQNWISSYITLP
ncbi:MAG: hypothetical protein IKK43_00315 [Clostridia bacterium]|nr:hypothetical protein [Clostridia bacterium]